MSRTVFPSFFLQVFRVRKNRRFPRNHQNYTKFFLRNSPQSRKLSDFSDGSGEASKNCISFVEAAQHWNFTLVFWCLKPVSATPPVRETTSWLQNTHKWIKKSLTERRLIRTSHGGPDRFRQSLCNTFFEIFYLGGGTRFPPPPPHRRRSWHGLLGHVQLRAN